MNFNIVNSKFPQIYCDNPDIDLLRQMGFKYNRVQNRMVSSSVAHAKSHLTDHKFGEFLNKLAEWNTVKLNRSVVSEKFRSKLRPYQLDGVRRLLSSKSLLLGDEMGLGKTIQTAVALSTLGASAVVVCPNHLVKNWCRELREWTDKMVVDERTTIPNGAKWGKVSRGVIYVIPYSQIHKIQSLKCDVLVCDESHYLNNLGSRRTNGVNTIEADRRWFLSGTAYKNHPVELWAQIVLLGLSDFFGGSKSGFFLGFGLADLIQEKKPSGPRFGRGGVQRKTVPTHLKPKKELSPESMDFLKLALKPFYLRRDKSKHLDLPPKVRTFYTFGKCSGVESKLVKQYRDVDLDTLLEIDHVSELAKIRIDTANKLVGSPEFEQYLADVLHKPTIIFTYHNEVLRNVCGKLEEMNVEFSTIAVGDSADEIEETTQWFQNCDTGVVVISIKKGSTGLTLTNAERIIFVELDWTVSELDQCESRVHRFGKNGNVLIDYVTTHGGVDVMVLDKLQTKEQYNEVLGE